jgi:hypothetical protein
MIRILLSACAAGAICACLASPAQAADEISWGSFPNLHDGDTINVTKEAGKAGKDEVEVVLILSPRLSWVKAVRALDANGNELARIEVKDNFKTASFRVNVTQAARLELVKGKLFGVPTGMYQISDLRSLAEHRVTLEWARD